MFAGFMMNAWTIATIVAVVAGVVGFFVVLRGSAFPAHAIPNGAFAGAAGASLLGISTLVGLAVFSLLGALGIGALGRRGRQRRRDRPRPGHDARPRRRVPVPDHRVRAGDLLPALRRGPRREHQPRSCPSPRSASPASRRSPSCTGRSCSPPSSPRSPRPRASAATASRSCFLLVVALATAMTVPVVGALLIFSLMIGPPAAARSLTSRPLLAMVLSVAHRPGHRVGRDRRLLPVQLARRLLRRHPRRALLRRRPRLGRLAPHPNRRPSSAPGWPRTGPERTNIRPARLTRETQPLCRPIQARRKLARQCCARPAVTAPQQTYDRWPVVLRHDDYAPGQGHRPSQRQEPLVHGDGHRCGGTRARHASPDAGQ